MVILPSGDLEFYEGGNLLFLLLATTAVEKNSYINYIFHLELNCRF